MPLDILPSVCPHDCPSACALEVERIDGSRIGRIRGARSQTYTRRRRLRQGRALCRAPAPSRPAGAAVAPGRRQGRRPCRVQADLVGRRARRGGRAADPRRAAPRHARRCGRTTIPARWGWCSATGSSGCATRCAIRASILTICNTLTDAGWMAGVGAQARRRRARDRQIRPDRRVGRQPGLDPGQRDDPYRRARGRSAARSSSSSTPTAPPPPRSPTCIWRRSPAPMARSPAR